MDVSGVCSCSSWWWCTVWFMNHDVCLCLLAVLWVRAVRQCTVHQKQLRVNCHIMMWACVARVGTQLTLLSMHTQSGSLLLHAIQPYVNTSYVLSRWLASHAQECGGFQISASVVGGTTSAHLPFDHVWAMIWSGARGNIAGTVL